MSASWSIRKSRSVMPGTGTRPPVEDLLDAGDGVTSIVEASRHVFGVGARHVADLSAIDQSDGDGALIMGIVWLVVDPHPAIGTDS